MTHPALEVLVKAVAEEVATMLKPELARLSEHQVQPVLLTVKQAAVYLGRSEQSVQHLIFQKEVPVVRIGRRVHLDRRDLESWIEKYKY
jgi:excisionase family DNA binding protein